MSPAFFLQRLRRRQAGFTLVEMAIVLILTGILIGQGLLIATAYTRVQQVETTDTRLDAIEAALKAYAALNGALPCPADAALAEGDAGEGVERRRAGNPAVVGGCETGARLRAVPWATLGLPRETALDGWSRRITYAVDGTVPARAVTRRAEGTEPGGLDMRACNPAATRPTPLSTAANCSSDGQTHPARFLFGRGLAVFDRTPSASGAVAILDPARADGAGGAAYVLVAHGANGLGAVTAGGETIDGAVGAEAENVDDDGVFVAARPSEEEGAVFDDRVRFRSILDVATRLGLGPRVPGS